MRNQGKVILLVLFIFYVFFPAQGFTEEKLDFKSYAEGIKLVKDSNKKGFIYFRAGW
jgi:hypothetical protein